MKYLDTSGVEREADFWSAGPTVPLHHDPAWLRAEDGVMVLVATPAKQFVPVEVVSMRASDTLMKDKAGKFYVVPG